LRSEPQWKFYPEKFNKLQPLPRFRQLCARLHILIETPAAKPRRLISDKDDQANTTDVR
jgi:hypothetical protein